MKKRLQVFVSSTYQDLKPERQAAVEAILRSGHIPAGMELFAAGDASQMDIIKRWIDESDVYMLILGGRYGAVEPKTGTSYVELEYDYALTKEKALFAVVISESALENRRVGPSTETQFEQQRLKAYYAFRAKVLTRISRFFDEPKDIKLAVHETLGEFVQTRQFVGWISGADVAEPKPLIDEIGRLTTLNQTFRKSLDAASEELVKLQAGRSGIVHSENAIIAALQGTSVTVPATVAGSKNDVDATILQLFAAFGDKLVLGVSNAATASATDAFLFYKVMPKLAIYSLAEKTRVPANVQWQRMHLSQQGKKLLATVHTRIVTESAPGGGLTQNVRPSPIEQESGNAETESPSRKESMSSNESANSHNKVSPAQSSFTDVGGGKSTTSPRRRKRRHERTGEKG